MAYGKRRQWTVRVVRPVSETGEGAIWECLRYAGLVRVLSSDESRVVLEIRSPHGVDSEIWARMNAERMQSFGWNAVMAPTWQAGEVLP